MVAATHRLSSAEQISELLRNQPGPFNVVGKCTLQAFRVHASSGPRDTFCYAAQGLVDHDSKDQVAVFHAGTPLQLVQDELKKGGQVIPVGPGPIGLTLGGAISMNMPHPWEAEVGTWRDWILGMTVVVPNGEIVKCGSKAVKNVAGYDLQKLFIGARGTLGILTQVILKTYPLKKLAAIKPDWFFPPSSSVENIHRATWIQRTRRSEFSAAIDGAGKSLLLADRGSSTLWAQLDAAGALPRYPGDWVLRSDCGAHNVMIANQFQRQLMLRMKRKLDPQNKLNPGEFGFI